MIVYIVIGCCQYHVHLCFLSDARMVTDLYIDQFKYKVCAILPLPCPHLTPM